MRAMSVSRHDTIFALSSGHLPAAIGVIRISGPRAGDALQLLAGKIPQPRRAAFARVRDPHTNEIIDEALALFFPGPASETGEDIAELQLHGGRAVVAAVFAALSKIEGLRPAEAGEFTRRAFENGKLDLTRIEGLADLIYAETEAQRRQAFRQLAGVLGNRAEDWRTRLVAALALVEAGIDFSDEADVASDVTARALIVIRELAAEIDAALADGGRGERLREGLVIAIAGPPNAGKSTLLNRLARREAAIVSPYAGTTRDVIEVHLDLDGYPVTLLDTAGIRETSDPVEREGVARAKARASSADLILWVDETDTPSPRSDGPPRWMVKNKVDLSGARAGAQESSFAISATTGAGVDRLVLALADFAKTTFGEREPALVTRERQRRLLQECASALARALQTDAEDLLAEELRAAANSLGRLTGKIGVEEILGAIFRDFCIGK